MPSNWKDEVCESCIDAVMSDAWSDRSTAPQIARVYGSVIADHICDAREEGQPCGCACRKHDVHAYPTTT